VASLLSLLGYFRGDLLDQGSYAARDGVWGFGLAKMTSYGFGAWLTRCGRISVCALTAHFS
jgi:hypothetical protein